MIEKKITQEEIDQLKAAFEAVGIFFTPLSRRRLKGSWDEYHEDACVRRQTALELLNKL